MPLRKNLGIVLATEWLRSNRMGAYASSTICGCNTRRYHGLLAASLNPPLSRCVMLAGLSETLRIDGQDYPLSTLEFQNAVEPAGWMYLNDFRDVTEASFVFQVGSTQITKRVLLADNANAVAVRYEVNGPVESLTLKPLTPMRDFHALLHADSASEFTLEQTPSGVCIESANLPGRSLHLTCPQATFTPQPQWWYDFLYRVDRERGQNCIEDIWTPGEFVWTPNAAKDACMLTASLDEPFDFHYDAQRKRQRRRRSDLLQKAKDPETARLAVAGDAFIINRPRKDGEDGKSILAGFPWFADWGRDTFIALPGLLLSTEQFELAESVFETYLDHLSEGMIPNCFNERTGEPMYNSIDASLWFLLAAERYRDAARRAGKDDRFWANILLPASLDILKHYRQGTRFDIHADADGLLTGGSWETQLTWMDAKFNGEPVTPRYGKAVEVNALWHSAHAILAEQLTLRHASEAGEFAAQAQTIAESFRNVFWNAPFSWLNDVINDVGWDASLRPNQIFAVSLPHSPLTPEQQKSVLFAVQDNLLTPLGLRTLSPLDPRYHGRYGPGWAEREEAYHQGTVWPWLMGPFIEAYLRVHEPVMSPAILQQAKDWLSPFDDHLNQAGLGSISEIMDADPPYAPRGCFAQAWSVAEIFRVRKWIETLEQNPGSPL